MFKPTIIGIGELVWDLLPSGRQLGGAPVNFAYWCDRLGAKGFPVSAVGDDELGREALDALAGRGLDIRYVQHNALPTGRVEVTLSGAGIPQYRIVEQVAWDALAADEPTLALAAQADALCWGSLAQRSDASRRALAELIDAARPSCLKVFDINIRQHWYDREVVETSLQRADILKLNEEELPLVAELLSLDAAGEAAVAELVRRFGLRFVIHTVGADRSEIFGPQGLLSRIATPQVEVVDTVGAGDSFTAAFVTALLCGAPVETAHRQAVDTAARVCTMHGAMPQNA